MSCSAGVTVSGSFVRKFVPRQRGEENAKNENRKTTKNVSCRLGSIKERKILTLSTLNTEAIESSETLLNIYQITPCYIPEDRKKNQE
jgi:hypothetical protein